MTPRSGTYEKQPSGYRAFIPAALPPDPPVKIDKKMQSLLSHADLALGRLDGSIRTLPNPSLFVFMYVRKEAVLSSQIEGTQSSLNDVLQAEAKIFDPEQPQDVEEVLNYVKAMNYGMQRLETLPLSLRLITEIHKELMSGVRGGNRQPGEFRTTQNWIGPQGSTLQNAVFIPPPPQILIATLGDLENFLHDQALPSLITIGLAHAQFETIHPFLDGNGRMGRLLIAFMLYQRQILQTPVLYLSHYFKKNRNDYYDHLQNIRDKGDWESWMAFFLKGVSEVAQEATETARRIVDLREYHRQLISDKFDRVASNGLRVLEYLYQRPYITVNDIMALTKVTFPAANNLMNKFVEHELLTEITGMVRNRRFRYGAYIELFSE